MHDFILIRPVAMQLWSSLLTRRRMASLYTRRWQALKVKPGLDLKSCHSLEAPDPSWPIRPPVMV